jgi:hypothetical protein
VSFPTSLRSSAANLPMNCVFIVTRIDRLGPVWYEKEFYAQGEESSSV